MSLKTWLLVGIVLGLIAGFWTDDLVLGMLTGFAMAAGGAIRLAMTVSDEEDAVEDD